MFGPWRQPEIDLQDPHFHDDHYRRALEAEVTFQFRVAQRRWPQEMSEVHFLERYRSDPLLVQTATEILAHFGIQYNATI